MTDLWLPGVPSAPQDELVQRIHAQVERFAREAGVERPYVVVELADGSRFALDTITAEPGFGFVTLRPHATDDEDVPAALVVPVGSIKRIELDPAGEDRLHLGFSVPTP